ncbi:Uncharacterised protein [Klebsiella pneumoniae]|nr:Uncharacterised protein [Klebsiella pneumoniae]
MQIIQRRYCQTLTRHKRGNKRKAASNRTCSHLCRIHIRRAVCGIK